METNEFVDAIRQYACDSAISGTANILLKPPGRRPQAHLLKLSEWFRNLPETDRTAVIDVAREAAEAAIFGVLCIVDGVRVIEDGPEKGEFEIYYVKGDQRILLNPQGEMLHDIFNSLPRQ